MRYAVGIDLGSTTTKAVILAEDGTVLGRGITNSRSNYDLACKVALTEALNTTRFGLIAGELSRHGTKPEDVLAWTQDLERRFRMQQYLGQLRILGRVLEKYMTGTSVAARPHVHSIVRLMEGEAPARATSSATSRGAGTPTTRRRSPGRAAPASTRSRPSTTRRSSRSRTRPGRSSPSSSR
jgi:benzoyl-CoA reductase subunit A